MKTIYMTLPRQGFFSFVVRCLVVGIAYALANALAAILLGPLSRQAATLENDRYAFMHGIQPFHYSLHLVTDKNRSGRLGGPDFCPFPRTWYRGRFVQTCFG